MKAMILAAGVGSRLDPLTSTLPKPLVPVVNTPVMEHIVRSLQKHGFSEVYANLHYLPDKITKYFGDGSKFGINLTYEHEKELSGDAGGVRACRQHLQDDTFIVIMGDLITDVDLRFLLNEHRRKKALASIAVKAMDDVSRFGVVVRNQEGWVTGFQEKPRKEEALSNLISTGIYILEPEVFEHIPETGAYGFGRQLFPSLVKAGLPLLSIEIDAYWSDVGTIDQYRQANLDALNGIVSLSLPENRGKECHLESGARLHEQAKVEGQALIGKNSRVAAGVRLIGSVVIGENCLIEENAELTDSVIWDGAHVCPGAKLQKCVVGENCLVEKGTSSNNDAIVAPLKNDPRQAVAVP